MKNKGVGIKGHFVNHQGRGCCISTLLNAGVHPQEVAKRTGHRDVETMYNSYFTRSDIRLQKETETLISGFNSGLRQPSVEGGFDLPPAVLPPEVRIEEKASSPVKREWREPLRNIENRFEPSIAFPPAIGSRVPFSDIENGTQPSITVPAVSRCPPVFPVVARRPYRGIVRTMQSSPHVEQVCELNGSELSSNQLSERSLAVPSVSRSPPLQDLETPRPYYGHDGNELSSSQQSERSIAVPSVSRSPTLLDMETPRPCYNQGRRQESSGHLDQVCEVNGNGVSCSQPTEPSIAEPPMSDYRSFFGVELPRASHGISRRFQSSPHSEKVTEEDGNKIISAKPSMEQMFCNQQSLWRDNNKLMREFMEFMRYRSSSNN